MRMIEIVARRFGTFGFFEKAFFVTILTKAFILKQSAEISLMNPGLFLFIFVLFSIQLQYKLKKAGVLGIRTQGRRMGGTDETTEIWFPEEFYNQITYNVHDKFLKVSHSI